MAYSLIFALLLISIILYFRLADHFNIIDKPNERSSHTTVTIRGGGVVFPIAIVLWFLFFGFGYPWFTLGLILISAISFLDDLYTLSTKPRLVVHFLSVVLLLFDLGVFALPVYWWFVAFVVIIGWINAFNFMDGINGITVFYALAVIVPVYYLNTTMQFVEPSLIYVVGISALIFAFFNARKRARTFAGDVGSVSLAFILGFFLVKLILETGNLEYITLVAVYGVDAVLTIAHRLIKRENIFKPHRSHLYQYMANELKIPHVAVSLIYGTLQLATSFIIIGTISSNNSQMVALSILMLLAVIYLISKGMILNRLKLKST